VTTIAATVTDYDITTTASTNSNANTSSNSGDKSSSDDNNNDDTVANNIPIIAVSSDDGAGKVDRLHCVHADRMRQIDATGAVPWSVLRLGGGAFHGETHS
jgi:hypothetical protein